MWNDKKTNVMNASAIAIAAWVEQVGETHLQIQLELEKLRCGPGRNGECRPIDQILASLRELRAATPSQRMINSWVSSRAPTDWN